MEIYKFRLFHFKDLLQQPLKGDTGSAGGSLDVQNKHCPLPRSGHRMVILGHNLYSFGGFNPSDELEDYDDDWWQRHKPLFKELWKFNTISRSWQRLESVDVMPDELASHTAVVHGSYMLVYGGTATPFGESSSNSVCMCHLPSGKWLPMSTSGEMPEAMYGQGVVLKSNTLYTVGGTKGFEYSLKVHQLDLMSRVWTQLTPKDQEESIFDRRYRHEVVEYDGNLLIFGGGTREESFDLDMLPAFSLAHRNWFKITTHPDPARGYPKPRKCHVLVRYRNYILVHGGTNDRLHMGDLWRLDLATMQWRRLMKSANDRKFYFHAATISEEGCIYLFGGIKTRTDNRTNQISQIWIDIPSLQTMAWEAMLHYAPDIVNMDTRYLMSMGIPVRIAKAIGQHPSDVG